jgi:predicted HNH restriction endonuclease
VNRVNGEEIVLPITTIYILGGRLAEIESPCIKVERHYRDMVHGHAIDAKSPFVEKLTHDSYVIQAGRITDERYGTKLNELLSLFEQAHFIREDSEISKQYSYRSDDQEIRFITSILNEMVADPVEREEIEKEAEALRTIDALFGKTHRKQKRIIEEQEKALEEKDKAIEEKDKALEGKDNVIGEQAKALEGKDKTIEEKEKALEEKDNVIGEQAKVLEEQAKQLADLKRRLNIK